MPLVETPTYSVDPQLDYEGPDLRVPVREVGGVLSLVPHRAAEALDIAFAIGDIFRATHGDPLSIPEELRGSGHEEEIAERFGRRFDPYSDLVKARNYARSRGIDVERSLGWGAGAAFTGVMEIVAGISGIAAIAGGLLEGALIDRTLVNLAEAIIAHDRVHDEKRRIGNDWESVLRAQIEEAIRQARIDGDPEASRKLVQLAITNVLERHQAFAERFPVHTRGGRAALRRALTNAEILHEKQLAYDHYMDHLAHGGQPDARRSRIRQALVEQKRRAISYHPDLKRYVSIVELEDEARRAAQLAARMQTDQTSGRRWPWRR